MLAGVALIPQYLTTPLETISDKMQLGGVIGDQLRHGVEKLRGLRQIVQDRGPRVSPSPENIVEKVRAMQTIAAHARDNVASIDHESELGREDIAATHPKRGEEEDEDGLEQSDDDESSVGDEDEEENGDRDEDDHMPECAVVDLHPVAEPTSTKTDRLEFRRRMVSALQTAPSTRGRHTTHAAGSRSIGAGRKGGNSAPRDSAPRKFAARNSTPSKYAPRESKYILCTSRPFNMDQEVPLLNKEATATRHLETSRSSHAIEPFSYSDAVGNTDGHDGHPRISMCILCTSQPFEIKRYRYTLASLCSTTWKPPFMLGAHSPIPTHSLASVSTYTPGSLGVFSARLAR